MVIQNNKPMPDCIFCKIVKKEAPANIIYEDEKFLAFLNINSLHLGQALLIPKGHYKNLHETPDSILSEMLVLLKKLSGIIQKTLGADGINIMMNIEPAAGQLVFHTHFHLVPRFTDDGFKHWPGQSFPQDQMDKIAEKIKSAISAEK